MASPFLTPAFTPLTDPPLPSTTTIESILPPTASPWKLAVERFNTTLTKDEAKTIPSTTSSGGLEDFISSAREAERLAAQQKSGSKVLESINAIIERISYYKGPIDTLAQTSQEAMFAWGSLKLLMEVVGSVKKISDRLAEAIADVVGIFGRCEIYARLFAANKRVVEGIGILYGDVLSLLVRATIFYGKSGVKRFLSASTTPFEVKFAPIIADIEKHSSFVQQEVNAAFLADQKQEIELQKSFRDEETTLQAGKARKEATLWLSPTDAESELLKLRKYRTADTCRWLQKKSIFRFWRMDPASGILWVYGIPGSGKSMLAAYIVDQMKPKTREPTDATQPLIFFFCSNRSENRRASTHILRSLVHQLTIQRPELWDLVDKAYKKSLLPKLEVFEELCEIFVAMLRQVKNVLCVIDGLDECQNREEDGTLERSMFAQRLLALSTKLPLDHKFKVLLTSRNEPDLASTFKEGNSVRTLSITAKDVAHDIQAFILSSVTLDETLQELPEETQDLIVTTLSENASGMFIWAKLMLQLLVKAESPEAVEATLQKLPRKLVDLYDRILRDLADRFTDSDGLRDLGGFVLLWAVYSTRQLTLTELVEARQIVPGSQDLVKKRKPFSLVSFRRLVQRACSPLVEVRDDGLLQLVHYTTKEYLLNSAAKVFEITQPYSSFQIKPKAEIDPHSILFEHCLTYLSTSAFQLPLLGIKQRFSKKDQSRIREIHPFLDYAATSCFSHGHISQDNHSSQIRHFLSSCKVSTWIEAVLVQGGISKLATIGQLVPHSADHDSADQNVEWIKEWFNNLQRVIFTWGGTLGETPTEIHHLHLAGLLPERHDSEVKLQRMTKLLDPTDWRPRLKPIYLVGTFVLRQPYIFTFHSNRNRASPSTSCVTRFHWLSMQFTGELSPPKFLVGIRRVNKVAEVQISESGRYILVVWLTFGSLTTCVWSISDDGFDPLPWSEAGTIDHFESGNNDARGIPYSYLNLYKGPGFYNSARCAAFSHDERHIYTPGGKYELLSGKKTSVPTLCADIEMNHASWSLLGERIACIRYGKGIEVYEQTGALVGQLHDERLAQAVIKDFSKSGRYVLFKVKGQFFCLYDVEMNSLHDFTAPQISSPFGDFVVKDDLTANAAITLSFSSCEKHILCLVDNSDRLLPSFLLVYSLESRSITNSQAFPQLSKTSPISAGFDHSDSTTLHVLVTNTNNSHGQGFVEYSLNDDWSASKKYGTSWRDWKADTGVSPLGGFVHQKSWARHGYGDGDVEPFLDFFLWDLGSAPPSFRGRARIPRVFEGWTDGYSQTNGFLDNGLVATKEVTKFMVGGQVFEYPSPLEWEPTTVDLEGHVVSSTADSQNLFEPILCSKFEAGLAWSRLTKKEKMDPTTDEGLQAIEESAYQCFLSPDESMTCFYSSTSCVAVLDTKTGDLVWFHQFEADVGKYVVRKPLFHPSRRILAWVEQSEKDAFDSWRRLAGLCIVEMESVDSEPMRIEHDVHDASNCIFHPTRPELYASSVGTQSLQLVCFTIPTSTISPESPPALRWHLTFPHHFPLPLYEYGYPDPDLGSQDPRMILYNGEIHFLFNSGYKIYLAKVERDGEVVVKLKKVGSMPGPPRVANVYLCAGWKGEAERKGRIDILCSGQGEEERPVVINSWIGDDGWDEVYRVEIEKCEHCERISKEKNTDIRTIGAG